MFIQRKLLEDFYHQHVRRRVFNCVLQSMSAITVLLVLFIVLYASRSQALQDNSSSILGVNLVLLLPLLGRAMEPSPLSELEKRTLDRENKEHIILRSKAKKQWKGLKELTKKNHTPAKVTREEEDGKIPAERTEKGEQPIKC